MKRTRGALQQFDEKAKDLLDLVQRMEYYGPYGGVEYYRNLAVKKIEEMIGTKAKRKQDYKKRKKRLETRAKEGEMGQLDTLMEAINDWSKEHKEISRSYILLLQSCILSLAERWNDVRITLEEALEIDPANPHVKHRLAWTYNKKFNKSEKALELLDELENDIVADKTELEILIELDDLERAEETYNEIKDLLKNDSSFNLEDVLQAEFACLRYLSRKAEISGSKNVDDIHQRYKNLIAKIPSKLNSLEAAIRNSYACWLIDEGEMEEGISQLEKNEGHVHSLHKIVSTYLRHKSPKYLEEKEDEIRRYIIKALKIDPFHYPTKRSKAKLDFKLRRWTKAEAEEEFWNEVCMIYKEYWDAFDKSGCKIYEKYLCALNQHTQQKEHWKALNREVESTCEACLHLDNAMTWGDMALFLWSVEAEAHKKKYKNKSLELLSAEVAFEKSIEIGKFLSEATFTKKEVKRHLAFEYFMFGSYLIITGEKKEGRSYLRKYTELEKTLKLDLFPLNYEVILAFYDIGEKEKAKDYLNRLYRSRRKNAERQCSPNLFGALRSSVKQWQKKGLINEIISFQRRLECSKRAYDCDPEANLNIFMYAEDLRELGEKAGDGDVLQQSDEMYNLLLQKYGEEENFKDLNHIWYVVKSQKKTKKLIHRKETGNLKSDSNLAYAYICFACKHGCFAPEDLLMKFNRQDVNHLSDELFFKETLRFLDTQNSEHVFFCHKLITGLQETNLKERITSIMGEWFAENLKR